MEGKEVGRVKVNVCQINEIVCGRRKWRGWQKDAGGRIEQREIVGAGGTLGQWE
ncbi:hypothetical protein CY34DRAFT_812529 [Suillus luteus UH-Slu-Lm8-n1]|uniref:Uncharacterized protein n=1 Tax=Suillus luteus UH-Slu-Lm8-n1 TaxID=930992 RepID=A0A0D0AA66_9AGAM|nr:hypothetical protein CY34DRAFT_812529 [Suillus luteus UH-Slu-Lm8-n1]